MHTRGARRPALLVLAATLLSPAPSLRGQADPAPRSGEALYRDACANCHGIDGTGVPEALLAMKVPIPDFTDCNFASREPDGDWIAVAHEGGPTRGFSSMMPAFGDALAVDQLQRVMDYVRTLCGDDAWPRGELNLPRALFTEKAFPEDEAVFTTDASLEGAGSVRNELVYERRFGARNQVEIVVPYVVAERARDGTTDRVNGFGDVAVGVKRDLFHVNPVTIVSLAAELVFPTGDENDGLGRGTTVFESFVALGQYLPAQVFVQAQAGVELPFDPDAAEKEAFWRATLGRTFASGTWGRAWTPMVEILGTRELASGAEISWDLVPQVQVSLNTRQHVLANVGLRLPLTDSDVRSSRLVVYLLWDWFDGGFSEGW